MSAENLATHVLRTLHRIHRQLTDLRGRLDRGPKQIRASELHIEHREAQLKATQEEDKRIRMEADAKQLLLKTGESKIEELKVKLNTANSNREYQALQDQIAAQKMTNSVLDDEILETWDRSEAYKETVAEAEDVLQKAKDKDAKTRREVEQQEPLIQADIARLEAELKEQEAMLPDEIRDFYVRGIRQKGEDALASVEGQICSGCNTQVPLNICADLLLGKPLFCRSCGRLLYIPEGAEVMRG
ncbi:MAG TPA: phospholipase [Thermoguttaceae bacterium]|nr:phospholipase [Thermoguttaceae bacterium]